MKNTNSGAQVDIYHVLVFLKVKLCSIMCCEVMHAAEHEDSNADSNQKGLKCFSAHHDCKQWSLLIQHLEEAALTFVLM